MRKPENNLKIPVLKEFESVANLSAFVPLPEDWVVGIADIVNSTEILNDDGYKTVNFVGAATISAVTNALGGKLDLFTFGGDGSHFAIPPQQADAATQALKSVASWAAKNFKVELRVAMISMEELKRSGQVVNVSMVATSANVKYAMFSGGGMEWAEEALKRNEFRLQVSANEPEPDLTGLSCQWGPVKTKKGVIVSLILKQAAGTSTREFEGFLAEILSTIRNNQLESPVSASGPDVKLPVNSVSYQATALGGGKAWPIRMATAWANAIIAWVIFKFSLQIKSFNPDRYRQEIAENSDFRKFSDGLMMTLDCSNERFGWLKSELESAKIKGLINYGLHAQDQALITCVVPSVHQSDHVHFIDGADGGYARAASELKQQLPKTGT